ncbi:MAG TPA: hypothetical protein VGD37_34980 [Kofleriaceae bacterium]|jgi:hypothetical protein
MTAPDPQRALLVRVHAAYERGRLFRALAIAATVGPMVLASFAGCGQPSRSIVLGGLLATVVTIVHWRGGAAARAVAPGLVAGVGSLAFTLVVCRVLEHVAVRAELALLACMLAGLATGAAVTVAARRSNEPGLFAIAAGAIAALGGALGCLSAGFGGVVALAVGVIASTPIGLLAFRGGPRAR